MSVWMVPADRILFCCGLSWNDDNCIDAGKNVSWMDCKMGKSLYSGLCASSSLYYLALYKNADCRLFREDMAVALSSVDCSAGCRDYIVLLLGYF